MSWIDVSVHKPMPISWWLKQRSLGRLNMQPGFQRRSNLWGLWKKAHLIDSIINGFDLPKFYLSDANKSTYSLKEGDAPYAVIDGKQRFEALFGFLSGEFPLNKSSSYHADSDVRISGLNYFELADKYPLVAARLEEFQPVVMSVATDSASMIEEMFVRLNSGVSINGAERRNAMPGPIPPIVRDITVHPFFGEYVRFSRNRMQEFNLAAKLLMFEFLDGFADTKAKNLDLFVEQAGRKTIGAVRQLGNAEAARDRARLRSANEELEALILPYKEAEDRVMQTLDLMTGIFREKDPLLSNQGVVPIYYWIVRNKPRMRARFRDFLCDFEPMVLKHVRIARVDPDVANPRILSYYNAARTSNDRVSMQQRYEMLLAFFKAWRSDARVFDLT